MALDAETYSQFITTLRRFVEERLRPNEAKVAELNAIPEDILADMRNLGLFGLTVPEEYGGLGLNMEEEVGVLLELGRTSPAFRSAIGTSVGIGSQALVMFGTEAQKQKYLPKIASGEWVASFALTEAEAGSDSGAVRTRAVREDDHYILNGAKRYITNAAMAGFFTVMARTNPDVTDGSGVSAFAVPRDLEGITVGPSEKKMGQQGAHIHDVYFDNVRVPAENRIGAENQGFKIAMQVLDRGRIHIGAMCVAVATRLIDDSVKYALERKQFGKPIADQQLVQAMIADSQVEMMAARALLLETARKKDQGVRVTREAAATKLFASEMVGRVADRAVQIFGGAGYTADHGIERFYRDVRLFRIYEGTSQIQQMIVARETLKLAK